MQYRFGRAAPGLAKRELNQSAALAKHYWTISDQLPRVATFFPSVTILSGLTPLRQAKPDDQSVPVIKPESARGISADRTPPVVSSAQIPPHTTTALLDNRAGLGGRETVKEVALGVIVPVTAARATMDPPKIGTSTARLNTNGPAVHPSGENTVVFDLMPLVRVEGSACLSPPLKSASPAHSVTPPVLVSAVPVMSPVKTVLENAPVPDDTASAVPTAGVVKDVGTVIVFGPPAAYKEDCGASVAVLTELSVYV